MTDEKKNEAPFDPAGLVENAFLMGIGVLDITREKAEAFAKDLIERGKMSHSEAKRVADHMSEVAETQQSAVRKTVAAEAEKVMHASGVATKSEVDDLKAQIAELKALLVEKAAPDAGDAGDMDLSDE